MDNSFEQCVRKADYSTDKIKYKAFYVAMIVSVVGAAGGILLLTINMAAFGIANIVIWGALVFLFFRLKNNAIIEYDYEYSDGAIKIARVSNSSKRKELVNISLDEIERITPVDMNTFKAPEDKKVLSFWLNADSRIYCIDGSYKGTRVMVLWEPKQELIKLIRSDRAQLVVL